MLEQEHKNTLEQAYEKLFYPGIKWDPFSHFCNLKAGTGTYTESFKETFSPRLEWFNELIHSNLEQALTSPILEIRQWGEYVYKQKQP
jgi:hypothetical protein